MLQDAAKRALADEEDFQTGVDRFKSYRQRIYRLHMERADTMEQYIDKMADQYQLAVEFRRLQKDVYFLRHQVALLNDARKVECAKKHSEEAHRRLTLRQLKEGEERLVLETRWAKSMMEKIDEECQEREREVAGLEEEKAKLLEKMGVQHMDQLPGIVPEKVVIRPVINGNRKHGRN